jgi:hypothetical protein
MKRRMTMANTDKRCQRSTTPILDDEKMHQDFKVVRELWVKRQPDLQEGVQWKDLDDDMQRKYYDERREQCEIRTTAKWDTLSEDSRRMQIESYNNTVDVLDKMMHVMYALQRPIPEHIRKIACKEFEW